MAAYKLNMLSHNHINPSVAHDNEDYIGYLFLLIKNFIANPRMSYMDLHACTSGLPPISKLFVSITTLTKIGSVMVSESAFPTRDSIKKISNEIP